MLWLSGSITQFTTFTTHTQTISTMLPLRNHHRRRGVGRRKNTYPPDLKKMRCVGVTGGGLLRLGWAGINVSYQSKSDRFDTGKPSLTAEFNPTNPLEQGLGDRFFLFFLGNSQTQMSIECQYCVAGYLSAERQLKLARQQPFAQAPSHS